MQPAPIAILVLVPTSRLCISMRLYDAAAPEHGPIWRTRCYAVGTPEYTEAMAAARTRMLAWAHQHGYEVHDVEGRVIAERPAEAAEERHGPASPRES